MRNFQGLRIFQINNPKTWVKWVTELKNFEWSEQYKHTLSKQMLLHKTYSYCKYYANYKHQWINFQILLQDCKLQKLSRLLDGNLNKQQWDYFEEVKEFIFYWNVSLFLFKIVLLQTTCSNEMDIHTQKSLNCF